CSSDLGPGGLPAVRQRILGNPDVGPEVSTELELGFDMSVLNERLSTEVTYYTQKVRDALMAVPVSISSGFAGSQSMNLGQMSNWGWEVRMDGRVVERPNYLLTLGFGYAYNQNRIDDLGGRPPTDDMREGWRYPSSFYRKPI